jgi:hypothetical protein
MRIFAVIAVCWSLCAPLWATTLQQLSLDDMIAKATVIVRGKALLSNTTQTGRVIYTHYQVEVSDQLKGTPLSQIDIAVPGGSLNGARQSYTGAPAFADGQDHFFFIWTSRTGLNQVLGLTQGAFTLQTDASGNITVVREASFDRMLDPKGNLVLDKPFSMPLADFKSHVALILTTRGGN